jgi:hypothetical protein
MPDNKGKKKRDPKNPYGNYEFDRSTKVSPDVIKQIKTLGMTKALASASSNKGNAAYMEGLKRMYGAKRVTGAMGSASTSTSYTGKNLSVPSGGVMGSKRPQVSGTAKSTKKTRSTGSQVGRGAAAAGAAAYGAAVYKQSKNPAKGIVSGKARGAAVAGKAQRSAYNAALKGGKTPAQAMAMAKTAKLGKIAKGLGKIGSKTNVYGTVALYAGEKLVSKAIKDSKKPKAGPGISRKKPTGGKGY